VLVPAAVEQEALDVLVRRFKDPEKEGSASDAEVERALLEEEEDGTPAPGVAEHASRIPAILLVLLLAACAAYVLTKALR
jgi:hypothetical protein